MRVSDEELVLLERYGGTSPVRLRQLVDDLREARAALRAWDEWRRTCCDEVDGVANWTAALRLTTKALEVKP